MILLRATAAPTGFTAGPAMTRSMEETGAIFWGGGAGADSLDGGIGYDTAAYYQASAGVLVDMLTMS